MRGGYGEIAGAIDENIFDKITRGAEPISQRPGELVPPALERLRKERGPFVSDDDLLLAAFYDDSQYSALKAAGPINTEYSIMETPLLTLVKEICWLVMLKILSPRALRLVGGITVIPALRPCVKPWSLERRRRISNMITAVVLLSSRLTSLICLVMFTMQSRLLLTMVFIIFLTTLREL